MAAVTLAAVGFRYPGAAADTLSNLHLTVKDGATHALLGASGAGKTTMLNLLSGLLSPTSGRILFDDQDVSQLGARERNVALVFQFPVLYETKSVEDNLTFPLVNRGWTPRDAMVRSREIARELGIDDVLGAKPSQLSLFQKQLTAIGKSLVRTDVDLVLLDEPLTAVEPAKKWHLRQVLLSVQAAHQLTMIYVTHDQIEALTFASTVSVLAAGRILQTGTPEDIYNRPTSEYVGDFIGSPGMCFIDVNAVRGGDRLAGLRFSQLPSTDDHKLGLRAEWVHADRIEHGPWQVSHVTLMGTDEGEPRYLLTVTQGAHTLVATGRGTWDAGDCAELNVGQWVSMPSREVTDAER